MSFLWVTAPLENTFVRPTSSSRATIIMHFFAINCVRRPKQVAFDCYK